MKKGKKYEAAAKLVEKEKLYDIKEAVELLKKTAVTKFDSTIDVSFRLNVNPTLADQLIRGTIVLPHGNGKAKRVLAVTNTKQAEAKEAGADFVGGKEMLDKIVRENWFDYDVIVATPDMMAELGKMGRVLGPKGLMPNPRTGTVSPNIGQAITEIKKGKISYRVDKDGNLNVSVARVSFPEQDIEDNISVLTDHIAKSRPASVKGTFILNAVCHTTMGPGIKISFPGRN